MEVLQCEIVWGFVEDQRFQTAAESVVVAPFLTVLAFVMANRSRIALGCAVGHPSAIVPVYVAAVLFRIAQARATADCILIAMAFVGDRLF